MLVLAMLLYKKFIQGTPKLNKRHATFSFPGVCGKVKAVTSQIKKKKICREDPRLILQDLYDAIINYYTTRWTLICKFFIVFRHCIIPLIFTILSLILRLANVFNPGSHCAPAHTSGFRNKMMHFGHILVLLVKIMICQLQGMFEIFLKQK